MDVSRANNVVATELQGARVLMFGGAEAPTSALPAVRLPAGQHAWSRTSGVPEGMEFEFTHEGLVSWSQLTPGSDHFWGIVNFCPGKIMSGLSTSLIRAISRQSTPKRWPIPDKVSPALTV